MINIYKYFKQIFTWICIFATYTSVFAQDNVRCRGCVEHQNEVFFGIEQFKHTYLQAAFGITNQVHHCTGRIYHNALFFEASYNPFKNVWGTGISYWNQFMGFSNFSLGFNANLHSNNKNYNIGLMPSLNIMIGHEGSISYGYNFQIINNEVPYINRNVLTLRYHIAVRTKHPMDYHMGFD